MPPQDPRHTKRIPSIATTARLVLALAVLGYAHAARAADSPTSAKYLLLDSRVVDRADGVRLTLGSVQKENRNPLFIEDKPWEVRFDNLYANVRYDEAERIYKLWYNPFIMDEVTTATPPEKRKTIPYRPKKREMGLCYATSTDGVRWTKPALGIIEFNGSTRNNLVVRHIHGVGVRWDPHDPDPARRYKAFMQKAVTTSPDGLHWSPVKPCPGIQAAGDTHNNAFWNPRTGKYVGITRLWDNQRIVGRTESADFRTWTKAVEVLRGTSDHQTYAMLVFPHANVYIGLLMVLHTGPDTVDCELTWSPDTIHWHRICPGTPLIPLGPDGSFDDGCIYAAAYPIQRDGRLRIYYGGGNDVHLSWRATGFGLATLRPDGFAGMKTRDPEKAGIIVTNPIPCAGKQLRVTADVANGFVRVAVLDADERTLEDCDPIRADVTDGLVEWRSGKNLAAMKGKPIRLQFELKSATLYAFSFTD